MYKLVVKVLDCGVWETSAEVLSLPLNSVGRLCKLFKPRFPFCRDMENSSTEKGCSLGQLGPPLPWTNGVSKAQMSSVSSSSAI